mmetsp:Transcript_63181/g.112741  ORF Transcript_63181/g.112741 Transcript_63181/m.112741 type:complete len:121 (-) Transcript_63181:1089-1451(-)
MTLNTPNANPQPPFSGGGRAPAIWNRQQGFTSWSHKMLNWTRKTPTRDIHCTRFTGPIKAEARVDYVCFWDNPNEGHLGRSVVPFHRSVPPRQAGELEQRSKLHPYITQNPGSCPEPGQG